MKVVLDTNVLIAAFITKGVCSELLEHCLRRHEIIMSEFILDEFRFGGHPAVVRRSRTFARLAPLHLLLDNVRQRLRIDS